MRGISETQRLSVSSVEECFLNENFSSVGWRNYIFFYESKPIEKINIFQRFKFIINI